MMKPVALLLLAAACGSSGGAAIDAGTIDATGGGATADAGSGAQDILTTDLALDLGALTGVATISVVPARTASTVTFEIGDLAITSVKLAGADATYDALGTLTVDVPPGPDPVDLVIAYGFQAHTNFDGWMPSHGVTFLWPYFCKNLFPCNPNPDDGVRFSMTVTGAPAGTAIYPTSIPADAPSYMPAIAVGDYTELPLGTTTAGTQVSAWYLTGGVATATAGTVHLRDVFDFYEQTYGPYTFGPKVGSVSAAWGGGEFGGMEHHPFWHVSSGSIQSEDVNAHEAAHGWYGDGVRIACWEDFVLSEGTVSYMAAHALEAVGGPNVWPDYANSLATDCAFFNTIALPKTCDAIDILHDPLWSDTPYMKGACFLEDVADLIGAAALDGVLKDFYAAHVGKAATMRGLIAAIKLAAPAKAAAIDTMVTDWLETLACPADYATRCGMHTPAG